MFSAGKATNELLKVSMKDFLKIIEAAQKSWQRRWDWPHVPPRTAAGRRLRKVCKQELDADKKFYNMLAHHCQAKQYNEIPH